MTIRTKGTSGGRVSRAAALALAAWLVGLGCAGDGEGEGEVESAAAAVTASADEEACMQDLVELERGLLEAAGEARASATCRADADCALVDLSVACLETCPTAVPASRARETRERAAALGEASCTAERRCAMHASCPPIRRAACVRGACVPDVAAWTNR